MTGVLRVEISSALCDRKTFDEFSERNLRETTRIKSRRSVWRQHKNSMDTTYYRRALCEFSCLMVCAVKYSHTNVCEIKEALLDF